MGRQPVGVEGVGPGNQVESVSTAQNHSHNTEQTDFPPSLCFGDHDDAQGDNGAEVDDVEKGFHNCLHNNLLFYAQRAMLKNEWYIILNGVQFDAEKMPPRAD